MSHWRTTCRSSAAKIALKTNSTPAAATLSFRQRCLLAHRPSAGHAPFVTMDLKEPGNILYLLGTTKGEMGGSHYHLVQGGANGGVCPPVDMKSAPAFFTPFVAIGNGLVRACHDISEGGLAVAVAEMAFASSVGVSLTELAKTGPLPDKVLLFSESQTRFIVEVPCMHAASFEEVMAGVACAKLGQTCKELRLRITGTNGEWIVWAALQDLKEAWRKPMQW